MTLCIIIAADSILNDLWHERAYEAFIGLQITSQIQFFSENLNISVDFKLRNVMLGSFYGLHNHEEGYWLDHCPADGHYHLPQAQCTTKKLEEAYYWKVEWKETLWEKTFHRQRD